MAEASGIKVRIRIDGEEFTIPVPSSGAVIEIVHERREPAPGIASGITRSKTYKLCLQAKGIQMR